MKRLLLTLLFALIAPCSHAMDDLSTYWVNSFTVQCEGVGKRTCLQVQKGDSPEPGEWKNFYAPIEGFTYEAGYLYKLSVSEEELQDVPADASSISYLLVEVLEKTRDSKININDIWAVTAINGEPVEISNRRMRVPLIEINLSAMRVTGNDGCNNLNGKIVHFDDGVIEFGPIAVTRKMCIDMSVPDRLNAVLQQVRKYRLDNGTLFFLDTEGNELIGCKKVD
ncbi:MAG: DUF4377 domain-containing protein [Gammaproteobacteria bacterium]